MSGNHCIVDLAHLSHTYLIERLDMPAALPYAWPCFTQQLGDELLHHLILALQVGQLGLSSLCGSQLLLVLRLLLALPHDWEGHTVFAHRLLLYFEGRTSLRCALGWAEGYRVEFIE